MAEVFHGPWAVEVANARIRVWELHLVVLGTTTDEGRYVLGDGQPTPMLLDGPRWTLGVEGFVPGIGLVVRETRRTTSFDRREGLVVDVRAGHRQFKEVVHLRCVSRDPRVHPEPVDETYDFTIRD